MFKTETFRASKLALAFAALALAAAAFVGVAANPDRADAVTLPYTATDQYIDGGSWVPNTTFDEIDSYYDSMWNECFADMLGKSKCYSFTASQKSKVSISLSDIVDTPGDVYEGEAPPSVWIVRKASTGGVYNGSEYTVFHYFDTSVETSKTFTVKKGSYAVFVYAGTFIDGEELSRDCTYDITIKDVTPKTTSFTLKATSKTLSVKGTYTLLKSKTPTISKGITWSSTNKNIATVDSAGKVTAKNLGKCTIKAKANGKTKSCSIVVNKKKVDPILKGSTKSLKTYAKYATGYKTGKWSSSNKSIATVTSAGKVKAKKAGSCKIYLKTKARTYTFTITVKDKVSGKVTDVAKVDGTNYCFLTLTNNTSKKVTYVEATVSEYNSSGKLITSMKCKYNESSIPAHSSATDLSVAVNSKAKKCKIKITYAKFSDGTTWTNK